MPRSERWTGRGWPPWLLRAVGRFAIVGGQPMVSLLSLPLAAGAMLLQPAARRGAEHYWRRQRPELDGLARLGMVWRQFGSFGRILTDRGLVYLRGMHCRHRGGRHLRTLARGDGGILLSAHVGNWELAGRLLGRVALDRPVHLVKVGMESPGESAVHEVAMTDRPPLIIDPRTGPRAALAINAALGRGELICMLGDRTVPGQPGLPVRFLGAAASVPLGPFHSAAVTGRPLLPCFLMRDGPGRYRLLVDPPWYIDWPAGRAARRAVLQDAAQRWAERLETLLACYPLQWHNFYDFWADARA